MSENFKLHALDEHNVAVARARTSCAEFVSITNSIVVMLTVLADEMRASEPGTAEVISAYATSVSGQALDVIGRWPS